RHRRSGGAAIEKVEQRGELVGVEGAGGYGGAQVLVGEVHRILRCRSPGANLNDGERIAPPAARAAGRHGSLRQTDTRFDLPTPAHYNRGMVNRPPALTACASTPGWS